MDIDPLKKQVFAASYTVHNALGVGFLEKVYENSLAIELRKAGFKVDQQIPLQVYYENQVVGDYYADLLLNDCLVIELKAVKTLLPEHQAQLINYLAASKLKYGLLINFGKKGLEIKSCFSS